MFAEKRSKSKDFITSLTILILRKHWNKGIITIMGNWDASEPIFVFVCTITEPNKNWVHHSTLHDYMYQTRTKKRDREFSHQVTQENINTYSWKSLSLSNWSLWWIRIASSTKSLQLLPPVCLLLQAKTCLPLRAKIPDIHTYFPRLLCSVNLGTWPNADK